MNVVYDLSMGYVSIFPYNKKSNSNMEAKDLKRPMT